MKSSGGRTSKDDHTGRVAGASVDDVRTGAALRDGHSRYAYPGSATLSWGRYRPPARYKRGPLAGRFSPLVGGPVFPQPDVRTFDDEL
jgi:hypothetical protein